MSLIGENGLAAPRLKNIDWDFSTVEERKDIFSQVIDVKIVNLCMIYRVKTVLYEERWNNFPEENRAHQMKKSMPADFEWSAYNAEEGTLAIPATGYTEKRWNDDKQSLKRKLCPQITVGYGRDLAAVERKAKESVCESDGWSSTHLFHFSSIYPRLKSI
ncbi:hypothetical protein COOONC_27039 [Cooperia oncophora]